MRRRGRWLSVVLWCGALGGAGQATAMAAGWWPPARTAEAIASASLAAVCVGLWATLARLREAEGKHSADRRAVIIRGIREAIARGDLKVPEAAGQPGPPYASHDRRRAGRPVPGGRRHDDPPPRRARRGGAPDA
jgi:hypothetical protein